MPRTGGLAQPMSKRPFAVRMDAIVVEQLFGGVRYCNADFDHLCEAQR